MQDVTELDLPVLLTTPEVAKLLRVDRSTMCRWRSSGTGPRATWLSDNIPRYKRDDVLDWLDLMTTNEVAALLRVHPNTLNRWRRSGLGPPVFHLSTRATRYRRDQVLTWLTRREICLGDQGEAETPDHVRDKLSRPHLGRDAWDGWDGTPTSYDDAPTPTRPGRPPTQRGNDHDK